MNSKNFSSCHALRILDGMPLGLKMALTNTLASRTARITAFGAPRVPGLP